MNSKVSKVTSWRAAMLLKKTFVMDIFDGQFHNSNSFGWLPLVFHNNKLFIKTHLLKTNSFITLNRFANLLVILSEPEIILFWNGQIKWSDADSYHNFSWCLIKSTRFSSTLNRWLSIDSLIYFHGIVVCADCWLCKCQPPESRLLTIISV